MDPKKSAGFAIAIVTVVAALATTAGGVHAAPVCKRFRPGLVDGRDVSHIPVVKVTDRATAAKPVTIEFEHGPTIDRYPININEDYDFFNFLVDSNRRSVGLYVSIEWAQSPSNIDMYLFDENAEQFAYSEWFNNPALDGAYGAAFDDQGHGGMGYESILGYEARGCFGFTVLSTATITAGENMTLKVWLGDPQSDW